MNLSEDFELLESLFLELDPLEDGFRGVLLEIYRHGNRYVLLEMASSTGNQLLRFSSKDRELVYAAFDRERGGAISG
jgi:sporulation-control protein spo0M